MKDARSSYAVETEAGTVALAEGRWTAARQSFERALRERETAEAAEGLSWAGWWLDDAALAFGCRKRALRLYRAEGDDASAARMATWLAVDHLDFHGALAVAEGWLSLARRLLEGVQPGPDHGWLSFVEGYLAHVAGDTTTAVRCARTTTDLGARFAVPDLQLLGLALRGAALVNAGRVRDGMRCLDEAAAAASAVEVRIPISSAWTCCFLVTACSSVLDYGRAAQWCDQIRGFADRYGSRYMLAFCRAEYGAVQVWRGDWVQAEMLLLAAVDDFSRSRPAWVTSPVVALADLRRRQGRTAETQRLLSTAGPDAGAQLCLGRLALDQGDPVRAREAAERVLRRTSLRDRVECLAPLELLIRASIATGDLDTAGAALQDMRRLERLAATSALHATTDLLDGMLTAAHGDHTGARRLLEDAVDGLESAGASYEAACARLELASELASAGRRVAAAREAAAALAALQPLGARPAMARARQVLRQVGGGDAPVPRITAREQDVLDLLAEGLTNRQIATRLVVSEHTVHRHVSSILRKLGVPTRTAAAACTSRSGPSKAAPA